MSFSTILSTQILGNNLVQWLLFIGILLAAYVGTRLVYFLFSKILAVLTKKTETNLDDLLVEALRGPIVFAVFLGTLFFTRDVLTLSAQVDVIFLKIFFVLVAINITWGVVRALDAFLANSMQRADATSNSKVVIPLNDTSYPVLKRLINFFIYAIAIVVIIQNLGFEVGSLLAGLGIGGLAFALAAQDLLGNLFGGLALITDKPFKVGDRVVLDGQTGFVRRIGLRTTTLETFDGTNLIMPNRKIADSMLENISREPKRRVKTVLGLEYATSVKKIEEAKKILADIVKKNKSTADESLIHFIGFGPSSLDLQLIYWIEDLDMILQASDEVNLEIKKRFEKANIQFAYPSQTIYIKK